jgi:signal transduction histidine kinase
MGHQTVIDMRSRQAPSPAPADSDIEAVLAAETEALRRELVAARAHAAARAREVASLRTELRAMTEQAAQNGVEAGAAVLAKANAILTGTLDRLTSDAEFDGFLEHVLLEIARIAQAPTGHLFLYDTPTGTLRLHTAVKDGVAVRGPLADDPEIFRAPIPSEHTERFLSGSPQQWNWLPTDYRTDTGWCERLDAARWREKLRWHEHMGHKATAALLLLAGRRPEGVVGLDFRDSAPLPDARVQMIHALASQAALALEMRRLGESARHAAVADERNRMAREIHDTLAQALALIVMQLAVAEDRLGPAAWATARKPLETVRELACTGLASARRSVAMLRPNGSPGLLRAIRDAADSVGRYYTGAIDVRVIGTPVPVDAVVEAELLGIAREAMTNAAKHSRAAHLGLELAFGEGRAVRLAVVDDGVGFDPDQERPDAYGLVGMRERAARIEAALTLVTEPGGGTQIVVAWHG